MGNLIDITYFKGETHVAQSDTPAVREKLERFITKYEAELLDLILGVELYEDFKVGLSEDPVLPKWLLLRDGGIVTVNGKKRRWEGLANTTTKNSLIAKYVFYFYTVDLLDPLVGIGALRPKAENGDYITPNGRLTRVWNEFSDEVENLLYFLKENPTDYPTVNDFRFRPLGYWFKVWKFGKINEFGL